MRSTAGRAAAMALCVPLLAAACSGLPAAESAKSLVVDFSPAAMSNQPVHQAVLRACGHLPGVPVMPAKYEPVPQYNVAFNITNASPMQLEALQECLARQPGVQGVEEQGGLGFG